MFVSEDGGVVKVVIGDAKKDVIQLDNLEYKNSVWSVECKWVSETMLGVFD